MKYKTIKVDSQIALYWPKMIKDYIYNSDKHIGVMENKHTFDICSRCQTPFGKHTPQLRRYRHKYKR